MAEEEKKEEAKSDGIPLWKWVLGGAGAFVLGSFIVDHIRDARERRQLSRWRDLRDGLRDDEDIE